MKRISYEVGLHEDIRQFAEAMHAKHGVRLTEIALHWHTMEPTFDGDQDAPNAMARIARVTTTRDS